MEHDLIKIRREALAEKRSQVEGALKKIDEELQELQITENVLNRLRDLNQPKATPSAIKRVARGKPLRQAKPEGIPSLRELVLEALTYAREANLPGMAPREIRAYVEDKYDYNMGPSANTLPSRMWRDSKEINKDVGTGLFSLPDEKEAKDNAVQSKSSMASLFNPKQGREAGLGGGT